ncbi:MAG: hypothetical protein LBS19_12760 [Clostridiales bacterium]|jgi:hypothetical protein|nr:hypothetical protein [Clostridiales bacterium]
MDIDNSDYIDTDDMPVITDFSKARPNPFAEQIKKHGFSVVVHYSPEDVANMYNSKRRLDEFDFFEHDPDELAAFERYRKTHNIEAQ